MRNDESSMDLIHDDHDLHDFQQRAVEHENQIPLTTTARRAFIRPAKALRSLPQRLHRTPRRYLLHVLVLMLLPLGLVVSRNAVEPASQPQQQDAAKTVPAQKSGNQARPVLGAMVMTNRNDTDTLSEPEATPTEGDGPITDPGFDDSLVVPVSRPVEDTKPSSPSASISAELANLRNGPGTQFDRLDKLAQGTKLTVLSRHEEWVQIHTEGGQDGWLSLDLLDLDEETANALPAPESLPTPPPAKVATITQDDLNLRDGPGTDYVSMVKLGSGSEVALLANYEGWYQVETGEGKVGWVANEFLNMQPGVAERITKAESIPSANPAMVGSVIDEGVNLRGGPSTKYDSLGKLSAGAELSLLARYKDWLKVETAKGTKGWISTDLVDVSNFVLRRVGYTENIPALPKAAPKPAAPSTRSARPAGGGGGGGGGTASGDVASLAWNYVGYRYVWGGESPSGFDCSGLVKYLYRQVGVSLPHSAAGMYSGAYGNFIGSMDSLQPGDILFYAGTAGPGITHVGLYVGGGTMVNAMTPASGVGAVSIYSSYWLNHYYGALRPYR